MNNLSRILSLGASTLWVAIAFAQQPAWSTPPKLVVGVVVDQMRVDLLYRYWDNFGEGGFKRLIKEGAFLRDAHYTYVPTFTGPGHASIYTGSTPNLHGIVANDRYDRTLGKLFYCVTDTTVIPVGSAAEAGSRSPAQLLATTLADEIERRTDRKGHTIGIALKDRSSILPIGRTGDAAYWYSPTEGMFISSTWYMKELPRWVQDFNARGLPRQYLAKDWSPSLPMERYHQAMPDANAYEASLVPGLRPSFPYRIDSLFNAGAGFGLISSIPAGNTLTTDMAIAAITGEQLGADAITDLLAISYSSTDYLGHKVGPRAVELEDMYIRLDREIARLLTTLDTKVGAGKYTLFLTADHGVVDVPAYLKDLKGSAGYLDPEVFKAEIGTMLQEAGHGDRVLFAGEGQIFLSDPTANDRDWSTARLARIEELLMRHPEVAYAVRASTLKIVGSGDEHLLRMHNGLMPQRCGDVLYALMPGYFEKAAKAPSKGTTHSSGWNYDTHVPVIFFGQGVKPGEVRRETAVADIVPTMTLIIGCALPDAAVGKPIPEVLK